MTKYSTVGGCYSYEAHPSSISTSRVKTELQLPLMLSKSNKTQLICYLKAKLKYQHLQLRKDGHILITEMCEHVSHTSVIFQIFHFQIVRAALKQFQ